MTLEDCTKKELLEILNRIKDHGNAGLIVICLSDIEMARETREINEAENWAKISTSFRKKYIEILKPYEGKKINEIPQKVCEDALTYLKAAERADKKYLQLMKIK